MGLDRELRGAAKVSLEDMLNAREMRATLRRSLLAEQKGVLVCFGLNIPGEYKVFPLAEECFRLGSRLIREILTSRYGPVICREILHFTGNISFFVVKSEDACELKRLLIPLEEQHPLGRLFDIDVYDWQGRSIHRTALDGKVRACLICGGPVWQCSRNRSHTAEELTAKTLGMLRDYFHHRRAETLAQKAVRALITEVCVTPKPGLVDRLNNGAHQDMDLFTFVNSGCELFSYFQRMALSAMADEGPPEELLPLLRYQGIEAEGRMYRATGGVNTHKGAIFSLGILCAAAGWLYGHGQEADTRTLLCLGGRIAGPSVAELEQGTAADSHGTRVYQSYGLKGVRHEAAAGFPTVGELGLPALRSYRDRGYCTEQAGVAALLQLVAHVEDTNMVSRSDWDTVKQIQHDMRKQLSSGMDWPEMLAYAQSLDRQFISLNLSPGGCADLLALCFFVESLYDD